MIDFSTLKGLTIPEGVVTKIESGGVVLWELKTGGAPVVLEVEKITSDTYAASTKYTGESFILLNIYPKTNGTVKVTYGGLTKTIKDASGAAEPNAIPVYFGTFNGVADSVETPTSGELVIEGDYSGVGIGTFAKSSKSSSNYCSCITAIKSCGSMTIIPPYAFYQCSKLAVPELPEGLSEIGDYAFFMKITETSITGSSEKNPKWETAMHNGTLILPSTVAKIGTGAFVGGITASGDTTYYCYLNKIVVRSKTPPLLGDNAMAMRHYRDTGSLVVEVPAGCGETYKAAEGWIEHRAYIVEAS